MKTRFDGKIWVMAYGVAIEVKEMETAHLLNTVKMLVQKPARVQAMLVDDIERATFADPTVWTPTGEGDTRKLSLRNVTSLSADELTTYVTGTPLLRPCWRSWKPVASTRRTSCSSTPRMRLSVIKKGRRYAPSEH